MSKSFEFIGNITLFARMVSHLFKTIEILHTNRDIWYLINCSRILTTKFI